MILINELLIIILAILLFEIYILKVDFSSPSFIITASFLICITASFYVAEDWGLVKIHKKIFELIIYTIIIFLLIEKIFQVHFYKKSQSPQYKKNNKLIPITISKSILKITILLNIVGICWALIYVLNYALAGDWISMMAHYKDDINTDNLSVGNSKIWLNQLSKIIVGLNYILLFIFNNNKSVKDYSLKNEKLFFFSFVTFIIFRIFLTGSRQSSLFFLVAWLTCNFICKIYGGNKEVIKKAKRKYIIVVSFIIAIIFPLFYFIGRVVGRKEGVVLEAATNYLATGILGLENIIESNETSNYWGAKSFPGLYPLLKWLGVIPESATPQVFLDFFSHGNTVSLLGRYYWDFQFTGTLMIMGITAFIFNYIYYKKIKYYTSIHSRNFYIILYCNMIHILYFAGYDDFAINLYSLTFILTTIIIYYLYNFIVIRKQTFKKYL